MFSLLSPMTGAGYAVTPASAASCRGSSLLRDVARRSLRLSRGRSCRVRLLEGGSSTPGTFVRLGEEEVRQKYVEEVTSRRQRGLERDNGNQEPAKRPRLETEEDTKENAKENTKTKRPRQEEEDKENNNVTPLVRSLARRLSSRRRRPRAGLAGGEQAGLHCAVMAGYMYKGSRRKYVVLGSQPASLAYYASFQAYLDSKQGAARGKTISLESSEARARPDSLELELVDRRSQETVATFQLCSRQELDTWLASLASLAPALEAEAGPGLQLPPEAGNEECADCAAPAPAWASVNLGLVVCITCSGLHRQLGSHVSKVRSLQLDTWPPHHAQLLARVGNTRANSLWEHALPEGDKIGPAASTQQRRAFIEAKYQQRRWIPAPDSSPPDLASLLAGGEVEAVYRALVLQPHSLAVSPQLAAVLASPEHSWAQQLLAWARPDLATTAPSLALPGTQAESILL